MKKLIILVLVLSVVTAAFIGCNAKSAHFSGKWSFSAINKVELVPDLDSSDIDFWLQEYDVEDEASIAPIALSNFKANKIFEPCYLSFDKKYTYTYDPNMAREATWVFYQTSENEGFISFYGELDAADGNPDPVNNPNVVYNAESDTMLVTLRYDSFMVTVELIKNK
jgi:hypothetical protein